MTREEAIEIIESNCSCSGSKLREACAMFIPELKENEDEKIRKGLVKMISNIDGGHPFENYGIIKKEALAYLEKQKEPHYSPLCNTIKDKIREYIANHFIADTVVKTDMKSIVKAMEEGVRLGKEEQKPAEWKPQPESLEALMYAIEGKWEMIKPTSYLSRMLEDLYEGLVNTYNVDETLLAELPKTAYSAEDIEGLKALKDKIEASMDEESVAHENDFTSKSVEWSEEDKTNGWKGVDLERYLSCLQRLGTGNPSQPETINSKWFKEHCRFQPKREWSEEDERMRNQLIYDVEHHKKDGLVSAKQNKATEALYNGIEKCYDEKIAWLKSLRPQYHWKSNERILDAMLNALKQQNDAAKGCEPHWKPSKQEIDAFETALKGEFQNGVYPAVILCELFQKLKQLYYNDEISYWRPSEEQIKALERAIVKIHTRDDIGILAELRDNLKKL